MKRLELSDTERADIEREIKKHWNPCPRAYPRKVANFCKTITGKVRAGAVSPGRFHDITAAIAFCRTFFPWYNTEHRHGGSRYSPRTMSIIIKPAVCWDQRGRTLLAA